MCWYPTTTESFLHGAGADNMTITDHGNGVYEAVETGDYRRDESLFFVQGKGISPYVKGAERRKTLANYSDYAATFVSGPRQENATEPLEDVLAEQTA